MIRARGSSLEPQLSCLALCSVVLYFYDLHLFENIFNSKLIPAFWNSFEETMFVERYKFHQKVTNLLPCYFIILEMEQIKKGRIKRNCRMVERKFVVAR